MQSVDKKIKSKKSIGQKVFIHHKLMHFTKTEKLRRLSFLDS